MYIVLIDYIKITLRSHELVVVFCFYVCVGVCLLLARIIIITNRFHSTCLLLLSNLINQLNSLSVTQRGRPEPRRRDQEEDDYIILFIRLLLVPPALLLMMSIISESGVAASDGHDVMMIDH